ncbi:hypothetical protein [Paludibacterium paludis]|uniref:hypothetical protein n=1 Tax=Paludibacterium paludis TaxID=1225769 RepID=UPI001E33CF20|nr:hypothetical protein [Paludibacterium paludis]
MAAITLHQNVTLLQVEKLYLRQTAGGFSRWHYPKWHTFSREHDLRERCGVRRREPGWLAARKIPQNQRHDNVFSACG